MNNQIRSTVISVIFVGQNGVGKTSLINNYLDNASNEYFFSTLFPDYYQKIIKDEGNDYRIRLWDTPGTERFINMIRPYLRNVKVVVLVFDMTRKESFLFLDKVLEIAFEFFADINKVMFILIGNKSDLRDKWEIKESDAKKFADILHAKFYLSSTKDDPRLIQEFLDRTFLDIFKKFNEELNNHERRINLNPINRRRPRPRMFCI